MSVGAPSLRRAERQARLNPLEGPVRTATFLFTDIEGATRLLHRVGEHYPALMRTHRELLRSAFAQHAGRELKTEGDSFYVVFESATEAVGSAVEAQLAIIRHPWPEDEAVRVRIGLHTGEAVVAGQDYIGLAVHQAARTCAAAHGGQVLVSEVTSQLVAGSLPPGTSLLDLGPHRLKDMPEPVRLFQVCHPDLPGEFPPLRTLSALPNNLPAPITSFVGRERELRQAEELLSSTRLLTLAGAGGTGKTRLALQAAANLLPRYPHGVWLVDLSSLNEPDLVPQTIASALGLREAGAPAIGGPAGPSLRQTPMEALVEELADKELLLLLDNCEHLIERCAGTAQTLLQASPRLRILATTREPLGIPGETVVRVPPLSLPRTDTGDSGDSEAVRLFMDRASRARPDFAPTERNLPAIGQIVRRLDGLPLAIELAAARVKLLTPEEIAARLDDAFRLLAGGSRTRIERHQTLRATVDWSYDLLQEAERRLFRRLSAFVGGFDLEAAEGVCAGRGLEEWEVLEVLSALVDRSLVMTESSNGHTRFRLLETMRQYGREKLVGSGEAAAVANRHLQCFLDLAERAEGKLEGGEQLEWLERLDRESDNLRSALGWAESDPSLTDSALRLAGALGRYWDLRDYAVEGRERLRAILARAEGASVAARWKGLFWEARLAQMSGDVAQARTRAEASLATARQSGDEGSVARSLTLLALMESLTGAADQARRLWDEGLALGRRIDDLWSIGRALYGLGMLADREADHARARALLQECLNVALRQGDQGVIALAHFALGTTAGAMGDFQAARNEFEACLAICRRLDWQGSAAASLHALGMLAIQEGRHDRAVELHREALEIRRRLRLRAGVAESLGALAAVAMARGRGQEALRLLGASEAVHTAAGIPMTPPTQEAYERLLEQARSGLEEDVGEAALSEGRRLAGDLEALEVGGS